MYRKIVKEGGEIITHWDNTAKFSDMQGVSGGIVNILGGGSMDYSE